MKLQLINNTLRKINLIGISGYSFEYLNKKTYKENYILNVEINKHFQQGYNNKNL